MNLYDIAEGCASCDVCEGSGYQTPPVLFAGNPDAPLLAIGQNPGEMKESDVNRMAWMHMMEGMIPDKILFPFMPFWYQWDFTTSPGYKRLSKVFGNKWVEEGLIAWTNAVRCRTPDNASPPKQMIEACFSWTQQLLEGRKGVIFVGAVARLQVLKERHLRLPWGVPKKHPRLGLILAIKHYSAWSGDDEATYREAVKLVKKKVA